MLGFQVNLRAQSVHMYIHTYVYIYQLYAYSPTVARSHNYIAKQTIIHAYIHEYLCIHLCVSGRHIHTYKHKWKVHISLVVFFTLVHKYDDDLIVRSPHQVSSYTPSKTCRQTTTSMWITTTNNQTRQCDRQTKYLKARNSYLLPKQTWTENSSWNRVKLRERKKWNDKKTSKK